MAAYLAKSSVSHATDGQVSTVGSSRVNGERWQRDSVENAEAVSGTPRADDKHWMRHHDTHAMEQDDEVNERKPTLVALVSGEIPCPWEEPLCTGRSSPVLIDGMSLGGAK